MNIYDKKVVKCKICKEPIGEINYDAEVILPRCGHCANPLPNVLDHITRVNYRLSKKQELVAIPY